MNQRVLSTVILTLICVGQSSTLGAAKQAALPKQDATSPQPPIQAEALLFKSTGPVQGINGSPAFIIPFQCTSEGAIFLDMVNPANVFDHAVYALLDGKAQKFSLSNVPDLQDVQRIGYFPNDSMVAFLVSATNEGSTPSGTPKTQGEIKSPSTNPNRHQHFVVKFDLNGAYKGYIQLPTDTPVFRLAVLPDGMLLVTGYDPANDAQQLLLLDAEGSLVRMIDQPLTEKERLERRDSNSYKRLAGGEASANLTTFVGYKDSVLAYRTGTNDPVLEIGSGGTVREVPLALPPGTVLADMVASDDQWLVHVNTATAMSGMSRTAVDLSSYAYYEVSPLDGSVLRKVTLPSGPPGSIACKTHGKYIAFSTDKDHKLIEFEANSR